MLISPRIDIDATKQKAKIKHRFHWQNNIYTKARNKAHQRSNRDIIMIVPLYSIALNLFMIERESEYHINSASIVIITLACMYMAHGKREGLCGKVRRVDDARILNRRAMSIKWAISITFHIFGEWRRYWCQGHDRIISYCPSGVARWRARNSANATRLPASASRWNRRCKSILFHITGSSENDARLRYRTIRRAIKCNRPAQRSEYRIVISTTTRAARGVLTPRLSSLYDIRIEPQASVEIAKAIIEIK